MLKHHIIDLVSIRPHTYEELVEWFKPSSVPIFYETVSELVAEQRAEWSKSDSPGAIEYLQVCVKGREESDERKKGGGAATLDLKPPTHGAAEQVGILNMRRQVEKRIQESKESNEKNGLTYLDWKKMIQGDPVRTIKSK